MRSSLSVLLYLTMSLLYVHVYSLINCLHFSSPFLLLPLSLLSPSLCFSSFSFPCFPPSFRIRMILLNKSLLPQGKRYQNSQVKVTRYVCKCALVRQVHVHVCDKFNCTTTFESYLSLSFFYHSSLSLSSLTMFFPSSVYVSVSVSLFPSLPSSFANYN